MTNEQTTGDDGKATFQLEYGDYTATITKDGYQTKTENIAFRSNHKNFSITLQEDTPTGTGTVTVTCQDSEQQPMKAVAIYLCNTNQIDLEDDSNIVAIEDSGFTGTATLVVFDTATHQPTEETAIPFGSYYLFAIKDGFETYSSALTVDGDETVTITLTEQ